MFKGKLWILNLNHRMWVIGPRYNLFCVQAHANIHTKTFWQKNAYALFFYIHILEKSTCLYSSGAVYIRKLSFKMLNLCKRKYSNPTRIIYVSLDTFILVRQPICLYILGVLQLNVIHWAVCTVCSTTESAMRLNKIYTTTTTLKT